MAKQLSLLVSSIFSIKRKNCFALLLSDAILIKTGIRPISFYFKDLFFYAEVTTTWAFLHEADAKDSYDYC